MVLRRMTTESRKTRQARLLTDTAIKAMKADPDNAYRVPDLRAKGLALRVAADGGKTWDLAFRIKGKGVRRLSLGRYEDVGLEAARQRSNALTSAARLGRDLIAEEKAARDERNQSFTVDQLIGEYLKRRVKDRLRTANDIERRLRRALWPILDRKATEIRRRELRQLFDDAADEGYTREAEKRRATVAAMFRWAQRQDIVDANPADGLAPYDRGTPRERALDEDEIRKLWSWLESGDLYSAVADVLKLQLLIGARVTEVGGMTVNEFKRDAGGRLLWNLPGARSKNKRQRTTPIVGLARELIEPRLKSANDGRLFWSESGADLGSSLVGQHILNRRDRLPVAKFSTHDLRRTLSVSMTKLGISLETVAMVIGHEAGDGLRTLARHYLPDRFIGLKEQALTAWDRQLRQILAGESGKVIAFRS
jgi:site-specific recombinase XerD